MERRLEQPLDNAFEYIKNIRNGLNIADDDDRQVHAARRFYQIAIERDFTRKCCSEHVQAACLYIHCRLNNSPYLLIDFSNYLGIDVWVLRAVFLLLCRLLNLHHHCFVQKPDDPSLFIGDYTLRLLVNNNDDGKKEKVSKTALNIITSTKRVWIQRGRKLSGVCGAALYISALSHGLKYSKTDIMRNAHTHEAELMKELAELATTKKGNDKLEKLLASKESSPVQNTPEGEVICMHKEDGKEAFTSGLCENCYSDFIELSAEGGVDEKACGSGDTESFLQGMNFNKTDASGSRKKQRKGGEDTGHS